MADVLILGGGVSGLSAGIYSLMSGHRVTICEKNAVPGGNLTGWNRGAYHVDNCIHWLTGTNKATELYKTWETLGVLGGVEIIENDTLYTYERGGEKISLTRDLDALERRMLELSPRDADETRRFIDAVRTVQYLSGVGGKRKSESYGALRTALFAPSLARYVRMTTGELASRFSHPLLSGFITALLTENFGAIALIVVYAHFCAGNADLVRGGSAQAARRMARRFTELGGELLLGAEVSRINTVGNSARSVTLADGRILGADRFVVAADPASVFGKKLAAPTPPALARRYRRSDLVRFSCFQCAFACPTDALPFRSDVVFELPDRFARTLGQKRLIAREFSHEPSFAPRGETVVQTMLFCDDNASRQFIALAGKQSEYEAVKSRLADESAAALAAHFPSLDGHLRLIDCWTPATYRRFTGADTGSFMSFAFGAGVPPRALSPSVDGLDNVYLASQWLTAPGGLPLAAECGKRAAKAIDRAEARSHIGVRRPSRRLAGAQT